MDLYMYFNITILILSKLLLFAGVDLINLSPSFSFCLQSIHAFVREGHRCNIRTNEYDNNIKKTVS